MYSTCVCYVFYEIMKWNDDDTIVFFNKEIIYFQFFSDEADLSHVFYFFRYFVARYIIFTI